ncbi:MAG: hypothetical protein ACXW33_04675 [Sulfuricurvum sp.]
MIPKKYYEVDKASQNLYDTGFLVYTPSDITNETMRFVFSTLNDYNTSISSHPNELRKVFKDTSDFLLDDRRGIILNRDYLTDDQYDQLVILNKFTVTSSFISAWYKLAGNHKMKTKTTNIYLQFMTSLGLNANELIMEYIQCEKVWMKYMKQEGVAPKKKINLISILAVLALAGIGYKIFF